MNLSMVFFNNKKINQKLKKNITTLLSPITTKITLNDLFMALRQMKKYILTNKNSDYLFDQYNDYLECIFEPIKPDCRSVITDDDLALEVIQNENWQHSSKQF